MTDSFSIDASELARLGADIGEVPRAAAPLLRKATEVTARHVKDGWRGKLQGSEHIPAGPYAITYDVVGGEGIRAEAIEAQIGPEPGRPQASIVGITETGTPTVSPRGYGLASLHENEGDFERGVQIAIDQALNGLGL